MFNRPNLHKATQNGGNGYKKGFRKPSKMDRVNALPSEVKAIVKLLLINADIRKFTSLALIKLYKDAGEIEQDQKCYVEFNNGTYTVIKYPTTEEGVKSYPLRTDYQYNTREFYIAFQSSSAVLAEIIVQCLTKYYEVYKLTFDASDKELEKIYNSVVQSVSAREKNFRESLAETNEEVNDEPPHDTEIDEPEPDKQ